MLVAHYYTHKPGGFCSRLYRVLVAQATESETLYLTLDLPPEGLDGVRIELIPFPLKRRTGAFFWFLYAFWSPCWLSYICLKYRAHTVISFGPFYAALAIPAKYLTRIKIILFCRSDSPRENALKGFTGFPLKFLMHIERLGLLAATRTIFMHEAMRASYETLLGQPAQTSVLLPNDISFAPPRRKNYTHYPKRILMAGRLTELKNFAGALREISIFNRQVSLSASRIHVTIVGDGPERTTLNHLIRSLEMKNVLIKPWTDSLMSEFPQQDLLIHPSQSEGMSNVVLEALAAGLPVLLSDIPAHRSLGEPKLLFSIAGLGHLAAKLRGITNDPEEYQDLIRASEKVEQFLRFDWDTEVRRLLHL